MKNFLFLIFLLNSSFHLSFGQISHEQYLLSKVNSHWKDISLTASESLRVRQCKTRRDLIQLHLTLVTDHLIQATASLSMKEDYKQKRLAALTHLIEYYQQDVFPLNTKYETPTPIFVDEAGTRCAVGELMYKSGQEEIVTKISTESNLSYIPQLNQEYTEVGDWAAANGFTIDELAWIQPQYPLSCNPSLSFGQTVNVSCHGGSDGGFLPDITELSGMLGPDFIFYITANNVFYLDSNNWTPLDYPDCLKAGLYKQLVNAYSVVTNEINIIEYFVEIQEPDSITASFQAQGDLSLCQGHININAIGGTPPYEYILYNEGFDTLSNSNLCAGIYWIEIKDSHHCSKYSSLNLLSTAVISPDETMAFKVFPNPTDGFVQLQINEDYPIDYTIYNSLGIKVGSGNLVSSVDQINLTNLVNGSYYFVLEDAYNQQRIFQKIIKTNF